MEPAEERALIRVLNQAGIDDSESLLESHREYGTPVLAKAIFMREAWRPILRNGDSSWIDNTIEEMKSRVGRTDLYAKRFLPEQPDLLAALQILKRSNADLEAVTHIVRQAQVSVLDWLVSILDGGHCFEDGLDSCWSLCANDESGDPTIAFGDLKYEIWEFDPEKERKADDA